MALHFHVAPRFRNFRGSTRVSTCVERESFLHARWRTTKPPYPFANSTANYVPTSRGFNPGIPLGDFCSLIPFRLLVVDDVVVWIVLSAFFASLPFLLFSFFSLPPFQWPVSSRVLGRGFLFSYSSEQTRGRRDCFHGEGRMSRMVAYL